jgi:hypothetical protein
LELGERRALEVMAVSFAKGVCLRCNHERHSARGAPSVDFLETAENSNDFFPVKKIRRIGGRISAKGG